MSVDASNWPVVITGVFSVIGLIVSNMFGRRRSEGARLRGTQSIIRVYDDYAEECRHAIRELGSTPPPWPEALKDDK